MSTTRFFHGTGRVQNVMFRQTLMRAAEKRGLQAGATNLSDRKTISFTLAGENDKIEEIVTFMKAGEKLNSWGAKVDVLNELGSGEPIQGHEVNTNNVNDFNWSSGVEMYL